MADISYSDELLHKIKGFVAEDAVGPSTLRGQHPGTRRAAVAFAREIDLSQIPLSDQETFTRWLDNQTELLRHKLPDPNKPWGVARKALNVFLRSCVYNHYLRLAYGLTALEQLLEVPLDSVVGSSLKAIADGEHLPSWSTLKALTPEASKLFQNYATRLAAQRKLPARVFLDNYLWLDGRN